MNRLQATGHRGTIRLQERETTDFLGNFVPYTYIQKEIYKQIYILYIYIFAYIYIAYMIQGTASGTENKKSQ